MKPGKNLEMELKEILDGCAIHKDPEVGSWSWVCILKKAQPHNGESLYRISHTGRPEAFKRKAKNDPLFSSDWDPIFLKVRNGADFFIKVLRRIFKDRRRNLPGEKARWFALSSGDIEWLSRLQLANSAGLRGRVQKLFEDDMWTLATRMRREGLY